MRGATILVAGFMTSVLFVLGSPKAAVAGWAHWEQAFGSATDVIGNFVNTVIKDNRAHIVNESQAIWNVAYGVLEPSGGYIWEGTYEDETLGGMWYWSDFMVGYRNSAGVATLYTIESANPLLGQQVSYDFRRTSVNEGGNTSTWKVRLWTPNGIREGIPEFSLTGKYFVYLKHLASSIGDPCTNMQPYWYWLFQTPAAWYYIGLATPAVGSACGSTCSCAQATGNANNGNTGNLKLGPGQ